MAEKEPEVQIKWCKDYLEICNLQSTYAHYLHMCMFDTIPSLFAQKTDGIEIEIDNLGVYEGLAAPQKVFAETMGQGLTGPSPVFPGFMVLHMTVNPVIEINKSGTHAKGLWHSPGLWTKMEGGELIPAWIYGKYVMEYVKEDGKWKLLKLNYRQTFDTSYDKGWVKEPTSQPAADGGPPVDVKVSPPDKPCRYHRPYSPDGPNIFEPPPPEPYND